MSTAADIVATRIIATNAEGFRSAAYDDATGEPIVARGTVTIGYGCACTGWSRNLARAVLGFQLNEFEQPLLLKDWYRGCDDVRRSALLEIQFNQFGASPNGLESRYPRMIVAVGVHDWARAAAECTIGEEALKPRYALIANLLATGVIP